MSVSVLLASFIRFPVPEMALATVSAFERLKTSVPLLVTPWLEWCLQSLTSGDLQPLLRVQLAHLSQAE